MPRALIALLTLSASLSLAQARPDAGVKPDAGVAAVVVETPKPPLPARPDPEVERLRRDVADLKALVEHQSTQLDALTSSLEKVGKQVAAVRTDLADAEQRRTEERRVATERKQAVSQAVAGLAWAEQQLATGSTNVADVIRGAEMTFTGSALRAVQSARAALANGDLAATRTWLAIAVSEAANPRD